MSYEKVIKVLQGGSVMAECGPMRLIISASVGKVPQSEMSIRAAEESFKYLERVARSTGVLKRKFSEIKEETRDSLAVTMLRSVAAVGDEDLTPMAAVAGTIGDAVADFLFDRGMTRVVVNNGGDVAVRLQGGGPIKVGVRPEIDNEEGTHVIILDPGKTSWGIATSGMGGRSFTRGVASAVMIVARNASLADAAATAIANASFVEDTEVIQRPAEKIDPNTDIAGIPVTIKVGPLTEEKKGMALSGAIKRAEELIGRDVIFGAFVRVQGQAAMTDFFTNCLVE